MFWLFSGSVLFGRADSLCGKLNGTKKSSAVVFNRCKALAAFLCAVLLSFLGGDMRFHAGTAMYSIFYGLLLASANFTGVMALASGNMAIATMIASFSLIVPCLYGIVFLNEGLSVFGTIGLVLCFVSVFMVMSKGKSKGKLSAKFWIYSFATFLANGICSVLQKAHQTAYAGQYQSEFLIFSMACATVVFLFVREKRQSENDVAARKVGTRTGVVLGSIAGACNCVSNYFILRLAAVENASVLFPVLSVLNSLIACVFSRVVFKEKLTFLQMLSIVVGITSVVLLKI